MTAALKLLRARVAYVRAEQDLELAKAVQAARGRGASWSQIGRALGVSRQAAQQRYGDTA